VLDTRDDRRGPKRGALKATISSCFEVGLDAANLVHF
jgi:hypothetical protein